MASINSSVLFALFMPMLEPSLAGFTIKGNFNSFVFLMKSSPFRIETDFITFKPFALKMFIVVSLSIQFALDLTLQPVYFIPIISKSP